MRLVDCETPEVKHLKVGDLVTFDPKHCGPEWAEKIAIILDIDMDMLTLWCEYDIFDRQPWWAVTILSKATNETSIDY